MAKFSVECMECGKKFKISGSADTSCPNCGGVDIDVAEPSSFFYKPAKPFAFAKSFAPEAA